MNTLYGGEKKGSTLASEIIPPDQPALFPTRVHRCREASDYPRCDEFRRLGGGQSGGEISRLALGMTHEPAVRLPKRASEIRTR